MMRGTGLALWEFEFPLPGSPISTFLGYLEMLGRQEMSLLIRGGMNPTPEFPLSQLSSICARNTPKVIVFGAIRLLITEFIKEDSPFCLTHAITRTMIGPCYTPLSLAPRDAPRRFGAAR